jgi:hypothetical protein
MRHGRPSPATEPDAAAPSPGLTWVLVQGRPRHVSEFAALAPRHRPSAACPECNRRLTLKLGRVRRHHAAHAPGYVCAATRPETALHMDVKFHIAAELQAAIGKRPGLHVRLRCEGARLEPCDAVHDQSWVRDWDEVLVETGIAAARGSRRPDILLRRVGKPVAAIEVLVSHAVSDDKAAALAAAGVPWIEVRADARLVEGNDAWRREVPLAVVRIGSSQAFDGWRCDRHLRRDTVLRAARVVDVYHDAGRRDRMIYRLEEQLVEGKARSLTLKCGGRDVAVEPVDGSPDSRRRAWATLRHAYAADIQRMTAAGGAFADSPMRWASGEAAANLVHEALADVQPGDPTPLATRYPRRWYFARERGRWFLPRDMRHVRWDRPADDAFAAHPAWAATRAVVRERPAPEGSWSSFFFAGRPTPDSFGLRRDVTRDGPIAMLAVEQDEPGASPLTIVLLTAAVPDDHLRRAARALDESGTRHLWLSHPQDWSSSRADLVWAAAGRDNRGRGVVLVDGVGVYRAEAFLRAIRRGDRRLSADSVRAAMSGRVARLGQERRTGHETE